MKKRMLKWLAMGVGLALLGWYLSRVNLAEVGTVLARLGWYAPLVLLPYCVVYVVDCLGWWWAFRVSPGIPFRSLFRVRWMGEAVNNVVPSGHIGGEALKVYLLQKRGVPTGVGTASVVVSKTAQTVAQLLFVCVGSVVFLQVGGDQPGLRAGMLAVLTGGVLVVALMFWVQRRGLLGALWSMTRLLGVRFRMLETRREEIAELDRTIFEFYHRHRARFLGSVGTYLTGWLIDTLEIYLVAHLTGMPITWWQALCVEAFVGVAKVLGMWMPGSLGVQESGIVLLGRMAGLPDALGITYALVRRAREVVFVAIGWILLYSEETDLSALRPMRDLIEKKRGGTDAG